MSEQHTVRTRWSKEQHTVRTTYSQDNIESGKMQSGQHAVIFVSVTLCICQINICKWAPSTQRMSSITSSAYNHIWLRLMSHSCVTTLHYCSVLSQASSLIQCLKSYTVFWSHHIRWCGGDGDIAVLCGWMSCRHTSAFFTLVAIMYTV